ncbi:MPA2 family protein involved in capsular polysaccharide export [Bordetella trematum]|uniref:MPA2 family protein involved in capsular polysaccharide export n=2 Tax=Bordetella trematum TaxID=123899 RepID=A0A157S948_9BORD|nr:MPA2 family protein involved in capsular polysaccharide export [Bordetella trematum]SAI66960.1 MPA2 family protein involved in capsular polysaccharide export [Bordetella trematum]SUV96355.1 MPA2 family protein involved in capsular polysaccharide export [Bordetella trematum]
MLSGLNPTSREETLYLREFLASQDMLNVLQDKLKWSEHYANHWRDPLFFLFDDAPREDLLKYYQRVVTTYFDEQTGLLSINVEAFSPEFAEQTLEVMLRESERFVNELSHKMAREQMAFAKGELANARKVYEDRRADLLAFQSNNHLLDAEAAAKARADVISELEAQLTKERTTLKSLLSTLNSDTPQVRQQRNRIQALEHQLRAETRRLVSEKDGEKLNVVASQYRNLTIDAAIAEEAYKFAVSSVESARIEASKKLRSLVTVVSPNKPDKAIYPAKLYNLFTLLVVLCLIYGIARFVIAAIEDHRD